MVHIRLKLVSFRKSPISKYLTTFLAPTHVVDKGGMIYSGSYDLVQDLFNARLKFFCADRKAQRLLRSRRL